MSRRRKIATPAPRVAPRRRSSGVPSRFEVRARAQTELLRNPGMSMRQLAEAVGAPYVVVRDVLRDEAANGTGLSQYRWPEVPEEAA